MGCHGFCDGKCVSVSKTSPVVLLLPAEGGMVGAARGLQDYRQVRARGTVPGWKKLLEQKTEGLHIQFFTNTSTMDLIPAHVNVFHSNLERMKESAAQCTNDTEGR